MSIVGERPEGGIRFDLVRTTLGAPWAYEGSAFTHDTEHRLRASIDASGMVAIDDEGSLPKEVVQRVTLLLRTTWKHASSDGRAVTLPRRLHRWRAG